MEYPFYSQVPKDVEENLRYRRKLLQQAARSSTFRTELRQMCAKDSLFFINTFGWGVDPRQNATHPVEPFITWPAQDEWIKTLETNIFEENKSTIIRKPRDMGGTYICIFPLVKSWAFSQVFVSFMLASQKEQKVVARHPSSLFGKIDFMMSDQGNRYYGLPTQEWLWPECKRTKTEILNKESSSVFVGYATAKGGAIGDRHTALLLDEFGAVDPPVAQALFESTTDVGPRIFLSTPYHTALTFREIWENDWADKIEISWSDYPDAAEGMYEDQDGNLRSPWLDREEAARHPHDFRVNVLGDFINQGEGFFGPELVERLIRVSCQGPKLGRFEYDELTSTPKKFEPHRGGEFKLWAALDANGKPNPKRQYVGGVDIAAGTGWSSSVICIGDAMSGEKVFQYADANIDPMNFARMVAAIGRWFNNALICPENQGPTGAAFTKALNERYDAIYWDNERNRLGFYTDTNSKDQLLGTLRDLANSAQYQERDVDTCKEMSEYIFHGEEVIHRKQLKTIKESGKKRHGDMVIATALMVWCMKDFLKVRQPGSFMAHEQGTEAQYIYQTVPGRRATRFQSGLDESWSKGSLSQSWGATHARY